MSATSGRGRGAAMVALAALLAACGGGAPMREREPVRLAYQAAPTPALEATAERVKPLYVRLRAFDPGARDIDGRSLRRNTINEGSGVRIGGRYVLTAAHLLVHRQLALEVQTVDGRWHEATLVDLLPAADLALLAVPDLDPGLRPLRRRAPLRAGEPVLVIGTPGGRPGVVAGGRVVEPGADRRLAYGGYGHDHPLVLEIEVGPGFSGGPVVDGEGRLVGMLAGFGVGDTSRVPYVSPRRGYAVPLDDARSRFEARLDGPDPG